MILNQWETDLIHWCPAQMYYYFQDSGGMKWCIYLRWDGQRGDEPWQAELSLCDDDWEFKLDCERVNLLEEKEHTPGIVTGFYLSLKGHRAGLKESRPMRLNCCILES